VLSLDRLEWLGRPRLRSHGFLSVDEFDVGHARYKEAQLPARRLGSFYLVDEAMSTPKQKKVMPDSFPASQAPFFVASQPLALLARSA
jgi:hypothetical protein